MNLFTGTKILVTGAAGFIGSSLSERLVAEGAQVIGIDCFTEYYAREIKEKNIANLLKQNSFRLIEADLASMELTSFVSDVDFVFHQAAQAGVRASWGEEFEVYTRCNLLATQRLLEACKGKQQLKRFVYASSSSIYGDAEKCPTPEEITPRPVSPYGVSKLGGEHLAALYHKIFGIPTVALRYFTVYGPRQRPDMAFHRLFRAALTGEDFTLFGDGEQSRDFTFIEDAIEANFAAARYGKNGNVYNVGGGSRVTMNEVIATIEKILKKKIPITCGEKQDGDVRHTSADCSRAKEDLGFVPKVTLEEGLRQMAIWAESTMEG